MSYISCRGHGNFCTKENKIWLCSVKSLWHKVNYRLGFLKHFRWNNSLAPVYVLFRRKSKNTALANKWCFLCSSLLRKQSAAWPPWLDWLCLLRCLIRRLIRRSPWLRPAVTLHPLIVLHAWGQKMFAIPDLSDTHTHTGCSALGLLIC